MSEVIQNASVLLDIADKANERRKRAREEAEEKERVENAAVRSKVLETIWKNMEAQAEKGGHSYTIPSYVFVVGDTASKTRRIELVGEELTSVLDAINKCEGYSVKKVVKSKKIPAKITKTGTEPEYTKKRTAYVVRWKVE